MEGGPGELAGVSMRTVEALFQLAADRGPDSVFTFKVRRGWRTHTCSCLPVTPVFPPPPHSLLVEVVSPSPQSSHRPRTLYHS
jgi:hypothetical protein